MNDFSVTGGDPSVPEISVIIPTFRDGDLLSKLLVALTNQSLSPQRFEVVVVNNDPLGPVDLRPWQKALNLRLETEPMPGSYRARNRGIRESSGKFLAFTDSDCIPRNDWLEVGLAELTKGIDRVTGPIELFSVSTGSDSDCLSLFERITAFPQRRYFKSGWAVTANLMVARGCFETVGYFDSNLLSGGDQEWGRRASSRGSSFSYLPELSVLHPERATWSSLTLKRRRLAVGSVDRIRSAGIFTKLRFYLRQFSPPMNTIISIIRSRHINNPIMLCRVIAFAIYLKYFQGLVVIGYRLGIIKK